MAIEYASAGTLSKDETLPWVIRIFLYTDKDGCSDAADRIREALPEFISDLSFDVYTDVMPDVGRSSSLADLWAEAHPGEDPGERKRYRISIVVPDLSHAEMADLSGRLADVVSPGWRDGDAAMRAKADGVIPCRVAVGRADEHPGQPPLVQN